MSRQSAKKIISCLLIALILPLLVSDWAFAGAVADKADKSAVKKIDAYVRNLENREFSPVEILGKLKALKSQYVRKKKLKSYAGNVKKNVDAAISAIDEKIANFRNDTNATAILPAPPPRKTPVEGTSLWQPIISGTSASSVSGTSTAETSVCKSAKVYDVENNEYSTVTVGGKCWTQSNLRTTKYRDGTPIAKLPILKANEWRGPDWKTTDHSMYRCPTDIDGNGENCHLAPTHGLLYQWSAAMNGSEEEGAQGLCPTGWHIPALSELEALVKSQWPPADCYNSDTQLCDTQGSRLAGGVRNSDWLAWDGFSGGINGLGFGSSGFNALPTGRGESYRGTQKYGGGSAAIWSSTRAIDTKFKYCQPGDICSWQLTLHYMGQDADTSNTGNYSANSIRCVQD